MKRTVVPEKDEHGKVVYTVHDAETGLTWWPNRAAASIIRTDEKPADKALALCNRRPLYFGGWWFPTK